MARYFLNSYGLPISAARGYHPPSEVSALKVIPLILLLVALCVPGSAKTHHSSRHKTIKGSGCVEKAVENSCQVVIDSKTGDIYNLLFRDKAPKSDTAITFAGTPHRNTTACMQDKTVTVSKWSKEEGIRCPPPATIAKVTTH